MEYSSEKEYIKKIFASKKIEVCAETDNSLELSKRTLLHISFDESDLLSLKKYLIKKNEFENINFEASLISKNYREEFVDVINHTISDTFFWGDKKYFFGSQNDENIYVIIDMCSDEYIWNKLENEIFLDYITERFRVRTLQGSLNFIKSLKRLYTLKIFNVNENSAENCLKSTNGLVDSCIFAFSSLKQTTISVIENFPQRRRLIGKNEGFFKLQTSNQFNLPRIKINPHLLKFYQLASSTEFESHKFLSYYHILEYFFLSVSDQNLYEKLSRRINDPKFKTNPKTLDKLISDINSHKTENDETEMLKSVLNKFINEDELIDFIQEFEVILGENIYTKKKILFGNEIAGINLQSGHVFGTIAKHIKITRNAIVHSSDRHERNDRFIPYSKSSMETLKHELPLLKFISEKIIISTAE